MSEAGELFVIGQDSVRINLNRDRHPKRISVRFRGEPTTPPCDHHEDELEWSCSQGEPRHAHQNMNDDDGFDDDEFYREWVRQQKEERQNFYLFITWKVSGVREIVWEATW